MKKSTLFAAMALIAMSASAQYTCDPGIQHTIDQMPNGGEVYALIMDQGSINTLEANGISVSTTTMINDVDVFMYIWDATFIAGDGSYPGVDFHTDGYTALEVANIGWSGAGQFVAKDANWNPTFSDDTHFHIALRSTNAPASIALIILDCDDKATGSAPAKVAVGEGFNDNGNIYPSIGELATDGDWTGIDITFGDLKKFYPSFNPVSVNPWFGNAVSFLAGGVAGKNLSIDAMYIYNPGETGALTTVAVDENAPVSYFNLQGVRVANPAQGDILVRVQGNNATKVRF